MHPAKSSGTDFPVVQPCPLTKPWHWIEIELLDEDGNPVAGEYYKIRLTDQKIYEGNLDENGLARYDHIEAGICDIWFPSLDGMSWQQSVTEPSDSPAPEYSYSADPLAWIDVRLVDEDGDPIDGERYELTLPDGTIEQGVLDEDGGIFVGGLDPGTCIITFPDLDEHTWEEA